MSNRHHIDPNSSGAPPPIPPADSASLPPAPTIRYLRRQEIDIARWDACVVRAHNSLIYSRSFYLDAMAAGNWDALVLEDYLAVLPLTWRRKAGIRYLYQPAFTQQTGITSDQPITPTLVDAFLRTLNREFRFAEIYLNYANQDPALERHSNFILPLDAPYETLAGKYKKDLLRNLKLAGKSRPALIYVKDFDPHTALGYYQQQYAERLPSLRAEDYRHFEELCLLLQQRGQLLVRAVTDDAQIIADHHVTGNARQPLCTAVLLRDSTRLYLLQSTTPPAGRTAGANHFLLDNLIREWAGTPLILDFEGSDQPGIAHFYENFGSIDQPYFFYRRNRLPWPLRWLK
jgi:hypothetical protein